MGYTSQLSTALTNVAVRQGAVGFTFDDLTSPATDEGATIGEITSWLAHARSSEFVEDLGFDRAGPLLLGPRRYRVSACPRR